MIAFLLTRIEEKENIKGRIIILDTIKDKPLEGLVVGVVNSKILEDGTKLSLEVKDGGRVLLGSIRERRSKWTAKNT